MLARHLEERAKRASKGDGPGLSSFEARKSAHLRMTINIEVIG
jgi:hypothetical protein